MLPTDVTTAAHRIIDHTHAVPITDPTGYGDTLAAAVTDLAEAIGAYNRRVPLCYPNGAHPLDLADLAKRAVRYYTDGTRAAVADAVHHATAGACSSRAGRMPEAHRAEAIARATLADLAPDPRDAHHADTLADVARYYSDHPPR